MDAALVGAQLSSRRWPPIENTNKQKIQTLRWRLAKVVFWHCPNYAPEDRSPRKGGGGRDSKMEVQLNNFSEQLVLGALTHATWMQTRANIPKELA